MSKLTAIEEALAAVGAMLGEREFGELGSGELVAVAKGLGGLRRHLDAVFAECTAEVTRQSAPSLGVSGLARSEGFKTPEDLISTAAELQVIPMVLGGNSEIIDFGRARRLFSFSQRLALGERDHGCVGCGAPPEQCITQHIPWWSHGGSTDLSNGVLLCTACHTTLHQSGYEIRVDGPGIDAKVWWVPPASRDAERTPRLAGAWRYRLVA